MIKTNKLKIGLFSFDGPMYKDCDGVYCNSTITDEMLARYFDVVEKLIVVIRVYKLNKTYTDAGLNKVEMKNCEVVEVPNFNSFKGYFFDRIKYRNLLSGHVNRANLIFSRIPSVTSDIVIKLAIRQKKNYLVEVGGCSWDSFWNYSYVGKLIAPIMYINQRYSVKHATYATYVTDQWLQNRYPTNGKKISASNVYLPEHTQEVIEKRVSKIGRTNEKSKLIIGTAAAVDVKYKGQEIIIKTIAIMINEGYDLYYELIGVGDFKYLYSIAKKYGVEDRVTHKGLLAKKDVYKWLDDIDIYAQPSKQEGLPRALIEAMSRGLPCIGSNVAGIPELLSEKVVFKKGSVSGVYKALSWLINTGLTNQSKLNYHNSKKFNSEVLKKRRYAIFSEYLKSESK
ncbi:glycosyltransferase [Photobacterium damselae]|nr:glycosyltransferase [Photobacterium damselae]